jgi:hypothetical protein
MSFKGISLRKMSFSFKAWIQACAIMMVISLISSVCGVIFISLGFNQKKSQELRFKYYKIASLAYFIGSKLLKNLNKCELFFIILFV